MAQRQAVNLVVSLGLWLQPKLRHSRPSSLQVLCYTCFERGAPNSSGSSQSLPVTCRLVPVLFFGVRIRCTSPSLLVLVSCLPAKTT